jgi:hypothetical protein
MELQAQGRGGFNGVAGSRTSQGRQCHELGEDDALRARGQRRSMVSWACEWHGVHNITGSRRMMLLWDQERHHGLGNDACVVDGVTDLGRGRWRRVKGIDRG